MRIILHIVLMIAILFSFIGSCALSEVDTPDWLEGTLFITTLGAKHLAWDNKFEWDKYVTLYNFDDKTISAIKIPRDASLTQNLGEDNQPIIISRASSDYSEEYGWESNGRWREYSIASYFDGSLSGDVGCFRYGVSDSSTFFSNGMYYFSPYGEHMSFSAPVEILGIKGPDYCVYYLEYGVSNDAELEIRFICENKNEKKIYERYPLDYQWGRWIYAISSNGNVAYKDADSDRIVIDNGEKRDYIPQTENTCLVAWKNNQELLLFTCTDTSEDKYYLLTYHVENGVMETVFNAEHEPVCVENAYLYDMDINQKNDCLAFCYADNMKGNRKLLMEIISLKDGMQYSWELYPLEETCIQKDYTITDEIYLSEKKYAYSMSDEGVYLFEPFDDICLEMAWN